jgi:hypothetical protein
VINFLKNYTTHLVVCNILPRESDTKITKHSKKIPSAFGGDAILENRCNLGKAWGRVKGKNLMLLIMVLQSWACG